MYHKPNAFKVVALCALLASPILGNNLFVLPTFTGNATANTASIYSGNPLTSAGTFTTTSEPFLVLAKPALNPADTKYYVISRSGSSSLIILNSALAPVGTPLSFGQNVTAAALTPDGNKLLVVAGNLKIYSTQDDSEIRTQFLDVGLNPNDIAVSQDSTRAFVMSAQGQRITAVDLTSNTILGNLPLPGITQGYASMGPNGLLYVSAQNRILEVDPRANPFDAAAVRRQFTFAGANLTRVQFTPDGTRALAGNTAGQSGHALVYLSLDLINPQSAIVTPTDTLNGVTFEKVFVVGNDRAYAVTSNTSVKARKIFQLQLPLAPVTGVLQPPVVTEAFFGSLGTIPVVDSIAITPEYPQAQRMFISAPLGQIPPFLAQNTIYTATLAANPPNITGQTPLTFVPGPLNFAGPATTVTQEAPNGIPTINAIQPATALGGRTLPFGVRVIGGSGRPLFGVQVIFTATTSGASIIGPSITTTNSDGIAMVTAQAPAAAGPFSVSLSLASSGLTTTFNFVGGSVAGGGGGGGGTGGTGNTQIIVLSGDGQVVKEFNDAPQPYTVRVIDAAGLPVANATVTWAVTQGLARFQLGTPNGTDGRLTTTTNAAGESTNTLRAPGVEINAFFTQNVLTATVGDVTATMYVTAIPASNPGGPAPNPDTLFQSPNDQTRGLTGKAGQILPGAITVTVKAPSGPVIPNVGLSVTVQSVQSPGPGAECTPKPIVLSNEQGVITCDLKLTGRAGTGTIFINVGGFSRQPFPLRVDAGDPNALKIANGNNQTGEINQILPAQLVVEVGDGGGNTLGSATVRWEIIQGQGTLTNSTTITDNNGRASNSLKLGSAPGVVLVRATALGGTQPTVTFEARVNVTVSALNKVSGDPQSTFTNSAFATPLVVLVLDNRQQPVPGVPVNFAVTSGSATLSSPTATTDNNGRAQVSARAGANAGPIVISATTQGISQPTIFNLTAQLPGPQVNSADFYNAASNERGAVVPGGIYTLVGAGLAPDLRGCIESVPVIGQLPTRLNQVEVQFGSTLAPIFSVCNLNGRESVTVQVPFEVAVGFPVNVTARVGAGSTTINDVQVRDYQPGTFETTDGQGRRFAVALKPDGSYVTPDNPARYNEIIRVYITGAGQVAPTARTGSTGVGGQKLSTDVIVGLNDNGVRVVSAEYAKGLVGVYEVSFEIPSGTQTGATRSLGILLVRPNGQFIFPDNSPTIAIAP